jgi:hypothetical protein
MDTLINNLLLFDSLNEQQIRLINHFTKEVHLEARKHLAEPGDRWSQLALVKSGVLRYNYFNRSAENITSGLIGEGNFITASGPLHVPFIQSDYLQAITACTLSVITKSGMQELSSKVPNWDNILRKISEKAVAERRSRILRTLGDIDPKDVAIQYLAKFPNIEKHISVDQILKYLEVQAKGQRLG